MMETDNEILVLIYETIQKELNQIKDTRVVIQQLANRVGALERASTEMDKRTADIAARMANVEAAIEKMTTTSKREMRELNNSHVLLSDAVEAMRGTLDTVTNPGISSLAASQKEISRAAQKLNNVHKNVMDDFVRYEIRLAGLEDILKKILTKQLLPGTVKSSTDIKTLSNETANNGN